MNSVTVKVFLAFRSESFVSPATLETGKRLSTFKPKQTKMVVLCCVVLGRSTGDHCKKNSNQKVKKIKEERKRERK